jgi:hypothetical protein
VQLASRSLVVLLGRAVRRSSHFDASVLFDAAHGHGWRVSRPQTKVNPASKPFAIPFYHYTK